MNALGALMMIVKICVVAGIVVAATAGMSFYHNFSKGAKKRGLDN